MFSFNWPLILTYPCLSKFVEIYLSERKLRSVVFPAPDAPMMARNCPGMTVPDTFLMISFGSLRAFLGLHLPFGGMAVIVMFSQET